MKKIQRIASALLIAAMVLAVSACGNSPSNGNEGSGASGTIGTNSQDPAELSILVVGDNTPPDTNSVLKEVEAKTNTKMKVTYVSLADNASKLNTLIAARTLPDIFSVMTISDAEQMKQNGMLAELTEYVGTSSSIKENLGDVITSHPLNKDGKIYALFNADHEYAQNMNIRTDWLKKVGKEMPTDLDSLYDVLYAFTYNDPDGNGKDDTIGLGASIVGNWNNFTSILGAYGIAANNVGLRPTQLDDGTVTTGMKNKNFLEAIKYFRKLYKAGVMDPDFAAIPTMDSFGKLWNGKVGAFDFQCPGPTNNWMPSRYTENPVPTFDFAEIKGPSGVAAQGKLYPSYTPTVVVSSQCKDSAAAVRLLDFFVSEDGNALLRLGVEGTHFNWLDKQAGTYEIIKPYDDSTTSRNDGVYVYSEFLKPKITTERRTLNELTKRGVAMADDMCTIEWPFIYTSFDADINYGANLKNIEKEVFCQLVSSKGDLEKEYKEAIARWESEGGKEWEKGATEAYNSQK
ncbi:carbohydrate ABC transporter substrate-binding protein (CUT1 family) [Anaerobacterium chartisolvens]|uniref:Carbohydrate ABC transporter substrate-binding protein (CUT1 family) n=1 Tax=Anaerobacterium chartisolvens TaxID=1297424 RepID=A0A369AR79_9FIRM|nr:extracellular solute-binding protein [Anaerobacterium chartisolvens]RCX09964.1 carbohydrate ABC transporter substrate-binding protein (CUT1 family) [Anaerobacterium chartisolvens]